MNEVISTKERVFMCICGASGSGKTSLILSMLTEPVGCGGMFQPPFTKIVYYYKFWQPIYNDFKACLQNSIEFVDCNNQSASTNGGFDELLSETLYNSESEKLVKKLAIFDDSCDEILASKSFATLATAGRHKGISVIFIKHNLYQQGKYSVTIDKNTTHIAILKSPRIGKQLKILGSELEGAKGDFLEQAYLRAMEDTFGHVLIDLASSTCDLLRYSIHSTKTSHAQTSKHGTLRMKTGSKDTEEITFSKALVGSNTHSSDSTKNQTIFLVPNKLWKTLRHSLTKVDDHAYKLNSASCQLNHYWDALREIERENL